jgi:CrcB protein
MLGALARYWVAQVIHVPTNGFPAATFCVNVSGSLFLGLVLAMLLERFPPTRYVRPFIATGFCGAYTTYSTFAVETDLLVKNGHTPTALAYVAASFAAGFGALWAGMWAARMAPLPRRHGGDR